MSDIRASRPTPMVSPSTLPTPTVRSSPTTPPKSESVPVSKPSKKPTTPPSLALQQQRENIYAQVAKINDLRSQLSEPSVQASAEKQKAIFQQIAKLTPPFLNHKMIGKTISEAPGTTTSHSLLRKRAIDSLGSPAAKEALKTDLMKAKSELHGARFKLELMDKAAVISKVPAEGREALTEQIQGLEKTVHKLEHRLNNTLWENVKESHIREVGSSTKISMVMALDARHQEVSKLMKQIGSDMGIPVVLPGEKAPDGPFIKVQICGSSELSSDIDINITAVKCPTGTDTAFVKGFNASYGGLHGDESGNDLDVNLYTEGVFPDFIKENKEGRFPWTESAGALNEQYQDIISIVKVRKFVASDDEWNQLVSKTLEQTPPEQRAVVKGQYDVANTFFKAAEAEIGTRIEQIRSEYPDKNDKELAMIANNRLYEEHSQESDKLKQSFEASGDQALLAKSRFSMGKAHYFANEAALSEGVLRRVVVNEQAVPGINGTKPQEIAAKETQIKNLLQPLDILGSDSREALATFVQIQDLQTEVSQLKAKVLKPVEITTMDALESFNENFGDTLKELNHHSGSIEEATIRSSKYLGRLCRDIEVALQSAGQQDNPAFAEILTLANKLGVAEGFKADPDKGLLAIRKDKYSSEHASQILADAGLNYASAAEFRTALIDMAAEFNAKIRPFIPMSPLVE